MSRPVSATVNELRKPPSSFIATFSVAGGAWPRTPEIRTRSGADLVDLDRVEAGGHVRAEVFGTGDLVEHLRRDRPHVHRSPGAVVLADDRRAVGRHLRPREAETGPAADLVAPLDLVEERVVAARRLRAALDHVAGHHAAGELVEVGPLPAVMPGRRPAGDRGVGDPSGDHDVRAPVERLDDPEAPEVRIRRQEPVRITEILVCDKISETRSSDFLSQTWIDGLGGEGAEGVGGEEVGEAGHQVVAVDVGDDREQAEAGGDLLRSPSAQPPGSSPPALDTTLIPRSRHVPITCSIWSTNVRANPASGALRPDPAEDEHRQLGQPVAGEHVDRTALAPSRAHRSAGHRRTPNSWRCGSDRDPMRPAGSMTASSRRRFADGTVVGAIVSPRRAPAPRAGLPCRPGRRRRTGPRRRPNRTGR